MVKCIKKFLPVTITTAIEAIKDNGGLSISRSTACIFLTQPCYLLLLSFMLISTSAFFTPSFASAIDKEMATLRMFYTDKELVISPTRAPKPVSKTAEDITIITSKDIERMNAHTVAEVLNRVPGVFVNFNQDFGATSLIGIQGAAERDSLVMMDGIPWNYLSSGSAETNSIPVGIIKRIEIIRGPGSSAWGSSLGGVINIITRETGVSNTPHGMVRASYGQHSTKDAKAEVHGRSGPVGYYLFAGNQRSNGLRSSRDFDNNSLYSKFSINLSKNLGLGLTMGYSDPDIDLGHISGSHTTVKERTSFVSANIDAGITDNIGIKTSFHYFKNRASDRSTRPGSFLSGLYDEETIGGNLSLSYRDAIQNATLGVDIDRGNLRYKTIIGTTSTSRRPHREKWAIYANDTISFGRYSITPGIRYDHDSHAGSFVSPSIGFTCFVFKDTVLRGSVARGFTTPPLLMTLNGSLDYEKIMSYQAGFETAAFKYVWLKTTFFMHDIDDTIEQTSNRTQSGVVCEAETTPLYNIRLKGGYSYVHSSKENQDNGATDMREYTLGIIYDDKRSFSAELFGHYVWWDYNHRWNASYDDMIWDLNFSKKLWCCPFMPHVSGSIFFTGHNLFDCSQYTSEEYKNPGRWVEAGIKISF
ncbi:MAG: TonB-dependent receptor plug domain-containing protein [Deltaproteobacteria bacterium]|nr:TonB-dependent receptor plug domain-containing protein [Deltaproteobacteria bacterium]